MADFLVRHGRNPDKVVRFSMTLTQVHDTQYTPPEELLTEYPRVEGDVVWILEIGTYELDINGDEIPTTKIHLTSLSNLDEEIKEAVEDICQIIDWSPLAADAQAPYVYQHIPNDGSEVVGNESVVEDVPITQDIYFKIRDSLPATGIDISSINVQFSVWALDPDGIYRWHDFDITSEVTDPENERTTGSPYNYQLYWKPSLRTWDDFCNQHEC